MQKVACLSIEDKRAPILSRDDLDELSYRSGLLHMQIKLFDHETLEPYTRRRSDYEILILQIQRTRAVLTILVDPMCVDNRAISVRSKLRSATILCLDCW